MGLWVWCWNQDAVVAVESGERVSSTQKSTDESVKDQGGVGCVFWLGRLCPSWICTTWSDGKQLYQEVLARLRDAVRRRGLNCGKIRLGFCTTTMRRLTRRSSSAFIWQNVRHPPYSLELAPVDFFPFPKLKTTLKGRRFQTIEEIQGNAAREVRTIRESAFQEAFQQWKKCWERCIASRGDYFEGDST